MTTKNESTQKAQLRSYQLTRREFLPLLGAATAAATAARPVAAAAAGKPKKKPNDAEARFVYVGTYTAPGVPPGGTHPSTAVGIYVFRMDPDDGGLTPLQIVHGLKPVVCRTGSHADAPLLRQREHRPAA